MALTAEFSGAPFGATAGTICWTLSWELLLAVQPKEFVQPLEREFLKVVEGPELLQNSLIFCVVHKVVFSKRSESVPPAVAHDNALNEVVIDGISILVVPIAVFCSEGVEIDCLALDGEDCDLVNDLGGPSSKLWVDLQTLDMFSHFKGSIYVRAVEVVDNAKLQQNIFKLRILWKVREEFDYRLIGQKVPLRVLKLLDVLLHNWRCGFVKLRNVSFHNTGVQL